MPRDTNLAAPERLLSVRDLAVLLQVSERAVWSWLASGRLPAAVRVGRLVRWRASDVEAWLAAGCPRRS